MADKQLIIADGHHRYETALCYREEKKGSRSCDPTEFAMMTFVDMDSPGLVILPTHRVLSGLSGVTADSFKRRALEFFKIEEVDNDVDAARVTEILRRAGQAGTAIIAATADRVLLVHSPKATGTDLFAGMSTRQKILDIVQLHVCLLDRVLGLSEEAIRNEQGISYYRDAAEVLAQVRGGQGQLALLVNPVRIQQVRDIALAGEVMPQKSTDFYPKLLSGLTIYALD
jgi:uncharacterized protein (DUF1015 family)